MTNPTLVHRLAQRVASLQYKDLTGQVVHQAKRLALDRIGCVIGGLQVDPQRELVETIKNLAGEKQATIWGNGAKTSAPYAALVLGVLGSQLEYDGGPNIAPSVFAAAETAHASGKSVILSIAAGALAAHAARNPLATEIEHHRLHWPGLVSPIPAAASCSKLLDLNAVQTAAALSMAGCLAPVAPFEAFTKGAAVKNLYGGWGNMTGVLAAQLASVGMGGPDTVFEGDMGLIRGFRHEKPGPDTEQTFSNDLEEITPDLISFKAFPSCTAAIPTLTALENILARTPEMDVEAIAGIEIQTYEYAHRLSSSSPADSLISTRVSIPFLSAVLLVYGENDLWQFTEAQLDDPRVQALMSKTSVSVLPDTTTDLRVRQRPTRVILAFKDGTQISEYVPGAKWSTGNPPTDDELVSKFTALTEDWLPAPRRSRLLSLVWDLENLPDLGELVALLV